MTDTILNTATALRLARRAEGVTVSQLAEACGITRPAAHAMLVRLLGAGELVREGGVGRLGHVYRTRNGGSDV
jgi:DNA-binding IclR family transcriptional regulator